MRLKPEEVREYLRVMRLHLPSEFLKELGVPENWEEDISDEFIQKVIAANEDYRGALVQLGKE